MVKIGVIGVGGWGKNHLRILSELNCLTAFCDIDPKKIELYQAQYGVKGYHSIDEMFDDIELDAVDICVPTSLHYEVALKALNRGLHIFVEKPLTYRSEDGEKLVEMAKEKGSFLAVGYIERFNPAVAELKSILKSRRFGDPLLLEFHRESKWAGNVKDVGVIVDTSVHDIDTARWIFESEPKLVFARTGKVMTQHEDFAAIILGFDAERTAFIASNWVTPKKVRRLATVCTEGIITIDFITQEVIIDYGEGTSIPRRRWQEPLMLEMKDFIESVEKGREPCVSGRDAVNTTKVAEAALVSSKTGSPIYLDL